MTLNSVVLPAPFGPIKPVIEPVAMDNDAPSTAWKDKVMGVANGPGEKIYPGELAKGLKLLAEGKTIDYDGATGVFMVPPGEAAGSYRIYTIKGGTQVTDGYQ